jgi:hypothetical protein
MKEWRGTASNINEMSPAEKHVLGSHLLRKYNTKMLSTLKDRVEGLQAGHMIDHTTISMLETIGVSL